MPMAFSNNPGWQAFHSFSMTANSMIGPDAMGDLLLNHKGGWDTPEMVTAIRSFFVDLRDAGCFTKDVNALSYDDASALFYTGKALLNPTGSWLANRIEANVTSDEIGFSVFPAPPGAKGAYWDSGIGSAWVISAKSAHQAAAAQFLDYLISPEAAVLWVGKASYFLPVQVDTANLQLAPLFKSILETLGSAAAGEISLGYNIDVLAPAAFNEAMQTGFQAVIAGDKSPEQQAADLQTAWQQGSS